LWAFSTARRTELHEFAKCSPFFDGKQMITAVALVTKKHEPKHLEIKKIITTGKIVDFELDLRLFREKSIFIFYFKQ